jgi:CheY-like chemotaxis protein
MTDMDGYELERGLRAVPPERRPTLVAVTGWGRPDNIGRTMEVQLGPGP